jgi:nucleoside 2-deoxyribosyltransferase
MKSRVYLAGPITGCGYGECRDWRKGLIAQFRQYATVELLDPMRGKEYLATEPTIADCYDEHVLSSSRGIMTRDHWDTTRCDILLVNLLRAPKVSIGTVMELAWAWDNGIPTIVVMEKDGNLHDHSMIREATGFRVETLEEAAIVLKAMLNLES